ncbi:MAG: antitoxin Xre/MbcA/ParS toxin-binding domain-containing protein [Gemmatimonadales bacterium]
MKNPRLPGVATRAASSPAGLAVARYRSARRAFPSDAALAEALRVDRSRVARWKRGESPSSYHAEQLLRLDAVVSLLAGFLEPSVVADWLHGTNAHLDHRRPLDVLREGRLSEVIAAIEAERSGAFA